MVLVVVLVVVREFQCVGSVVAFNGLSIVVVICQVFGFHRTQLVERSAKLVEKNGFVIQGGLPCGHGVGHGGHGSVGTHGLECGVHPWFKSKPVVEKQICVL